MFYLSRELKEKLHTLKKENDIFHRFRQKAIAVCIFLFVLGCKNVNYAINPEIETISVNYNYQNSNGVIFGREYFFFDENGESYCLTMDLITTKNFPK